MATQYGFLGPGLFATSTQRNRSFQVLNKGKDSILSFLAPVFHNFTPLEFPDGGLEREWPLRRFRSRSVVLEELRDGPSFSTGLVSCVFLFNFAGDALSLLRLGVSRSLWP
jgi:hypothetical protein